MSYFIVQPLTNPGKNPMTRKIPRSLYNKDSSFFGRFHIFDRLRSLILKRWRFQAGRKTIKLIACYVDQTVIKISVSDGAGKPVIPENGSDLVNIDWLLESILQSKYCKIEDFPIFAKLPAKIPKS